MDLKTKVGYAKQAIDSIITHDDVIMEAVELSAKVLHEHIDARIAEAKVRRAERAGVILGRSERAPQPTST